MNTSKLFEMYHSTFQPALKEGVYDVKMLKHEFVETATTQYIKFTYEMLDNGRVITDNKFEAGLGVMVSHLRQQLNREDEAVVPIDFFNELIEHETPIKIWVVKRMVNGSQKTNFNFLEPLPEKEDKPNLTIEED